MNALIEHPTTNELETTDFELNHFFEELYDPTSMWYDIKIAVLPGSDCIFVPRYISESFDKVYPLDEFIENTYRILQAKPQRIIIFSYEIANDELYEFEQIDINWTEDGSVIDWQSSRIDAESPQLEFTKTMFKHCEYLVK